MAKKILESSEIRLLMLHEFQLGTKAAEAANKINSRLAQTATSERYAQRWSKKFREGYYSLLDEGERGAEPKLDDLIL